jgi:hypothetical protein
MSYKFYIYLLTGILMLLLQPPINGDNKKLIAEKVKELQELNRLVISKIKNPEQFNGKNIFVRVKILPGTDKKVKFKVEKISVEQIQKPAESEKDTIYLKGQVKKTDKNDYKVDLSHILPKPEESISTESKKEKLTQKVKH